MKRLLLGLAAVAAMTFVPHTASGQDAPDLMLVHALKDVTASVAVDGTVIVPAFREGSSANISSFAGQTLSNVTITDDASGDTLLGPVALEIPANGSHSIVAHRTESGDVTLTTFENDVSAPSAGNARLTVRHTAEAGAIDLQIGSDAPISGLTNPNEQNIELPVGELSDAMLAPAGGDAIAGISTLTLAADEVTVVYVIGSTSDDSIDFVVLAVDFPAQDDETTTTVSGDTTTTVAGETTTTTTVDGTTTTTASTTTTTIAAPTAVNTGSPIGDSSNLAVFAALGGLALAGGAVVARRRV